LHSHVMTPEPKGRNSPVDLLGLGTPNNRSGENEQSRFSPFNVFQRAGGNGDSANVRPVGIPPFAHSSEWSESQS